MLLACAYFACFSVALWFEARNVLLLYVAKQCDAPHGPMSRTDIAFEINGSNVVQIRPGRVKTNHMKYNINSRS